PGGRAEGGSGSPPPPLAGEPIGSPVSESQRRIMRSAPPVSSIRLSGKNATDQTGMPGPTRVRARLRVLRWMMATEPRMVVAATRSPLPDIARESIGVGDASTAPRVLPAGERKYASPSPPAVTISPSGATATALSGETSVATNGASDPCSGQMRTVASYPALTSLVPSGAQATLLTF